MKKIILLVSISFLSYGQQTLVGTVKDIYSESGIMGASIILLDDKGGYTTNGASTNEFGAFKLTNIPLGRQSFEIRSLGYKSKVVSELVVSAGKVPVINVFLEENLEELNEVTVKLSESRGKVGLLNKMSVNSAQLFDVETIERFSGGRRDIARLARSYAGVLNTDDSRNDILVRGNSPSGVLWRLEGVPIPNPNHFAVSGTTGGPVSAVNINLLSTSNFLRGAFPAEYGDLTSGAFDLEMRNGNSEEFEVTAQIHATGGIEAEIEGPINKESGTSFLVGYRYALTALEIIPIGTNAIPNYQDLSFKLDLGKQLGGKLSLFGIAAKSNIDFLSTQLDSDDLFANPNEDLYHKSALAVLGANHKVVLGESTYIKNTIAYTFSESSSKQDNYIDTDTERIKYNALDLADNVKVLQLNSVVNSKINSKLNFRAGILARSYNALSTIKNRDNLEPSEIRDDDNDGLPDFIQVSDYDDNFFQLQSFAQGKYRFSEKWSLNLGLHSQYFSLNKNATFEPRGGIQWNINPNNEISFAFGKQTQTQQLPILFYNTYNPTTNEYKSENLDLDNSKSIHYILAYNKTINQNWTLKSELFYQDLVDIAVEAFPSTYSVLNEGANFRFTRKGGLVNDGKGKNYGVEATLERSFNKNYYLLLNGSLFESKYVASDGVERNTAFNNNYVYNVLTGKEIPFNRKNNLFTFFINTKVTGAGGGHYTPIDLDATINNNGVEVYDESRAFGEKYPDYFRCDLKIGLRSESKRKKISQEWSIDFLNITNRENLFIKRYNEVNQQINNVNQLSFFIDILYKIQF